MAYLIDLSIYLSISFAKCESPICEGMWEAVGGCGSPNLASQHLSHGLPQSLTASHTASQFGLPIWPPTASEFGLSRPRTASHMASHGLPIQPLRASQFGLSHSLPIWLSQPLMASQFSLSHGLSFGLREHRPNWEVVWEAVRG